MRLLYAIDNRSDFNSGVTTPLNFCATVHWANVLTIYTSHGQAAWRTNFLDTWWHSNLVGFKWNLLLMGYWYLRKFS